MISVLLTVPNLRVTESPYREMIAIAKYLPRDQFRLTICSLRKAGYDEMEPVLTSLGAESFVARFRPCGRSIAHIKDCLEDQSLINTRGPFDIQHSLDFTPSPLEALFAKFHARRYVYNQRDNNENGSTAMLKLKISLAERIIPISEGTTNLLLSKGANSSKLRKIYNGIDFEEETLPANKSNQDFVILGVGHLTRRKRWEDAIRALGVLSLRIPNVKLQIAGEPIDPEYFGELQKLARNLGLSHKVRFLGVRSDVLRLLKQANVLLHCAESEGVPWAILEAMMQELPIVASDINGINEVIQHDENGLLVPMGNISGFSNQLLRISESRELTSRLAENGLRIVKEKFSAKGMVEKLQEVYKEMLD